MKKFIPLLILSSLLLFSCSDDDINITPVPDEFTYLSGKISGELNIDNSPYLAKMDLVVDSNTSLLLNPGVVVYFEENTEIIVKGELIIAGNLNNKVTLSSLHESKPWKGVKILNADKPAIIDFVLFNNIRQEYDTTIVSSSITIMDSEARFTHNLFQNNSAIHGGVIGIYNGNVSIENNIFYKNTADVWGGAIMSENSELKIINNTFVKNHSWNNCGGILICEPYITNIQNNIFYQNSSRTGLVNIQYLSSDSTNLIEQFNFIATGFMDPKFLDMIGFKLSPNSACINAGNPDNSFNDYDGSKNDQGAYGGPLGNW